MLSLIRQDPNFSRAGKRWTEEETKNLLDNINEYTDYNKLSEDFKRSVTALKIHVISNLVNVENVENNEYIEELSKKTNITKEYIEYYIQKFKKSKDSKKVQKEKDNDKDFKILWEFKIFLKQRVDFDEFLHNCFDEFVEKYT
jgi:hypothetical protein